MTKLPQARGRQALGTGWVSYQLQELVAGLWSDPSVAPGQRFRIAAPPGVRISFATLEAADTASFAADFARALRHRASLD